MSSDWNESANRYKDFRHMKDEPEVPRKAQNRRKKTKRWCKGVEGREHEPMIRKDHDPWKCEWCSWFSRVRGRKTLHWQCWHKEVCKNCGKVLKWAIDPKECPDRPKM